MNLYLVQHAQAKPKEEDPARPLTDAGRAAAQAVAISAARLGLEVDQIRHSSKTRARQTAEALARALSPAGGVVAVSGLAPRDDVRPVAEALAGEGRPVMLVGHLPFMSRLAALLLAGDPDRGVVQFRQGGIVCLAREEGRWLLALFLTPEMAAA
jgi:phosphohistidine phosphatase